MYRLNNLLKILITIACLIVLCSCSSDSKVSVDEVKTDKAIETDRIEENNNEDNDEQHKIAEFSSNSDAIEEVLPSDAQSTASSNDTPTANQYLPMGNLQAQWYMLYNSWIGPQWVEEYTSDGRIIIDGEEYGTWKCDNGKLFCHNDVYDTDTECFIIYDDDGHMIFCDEQGNISAKYLRVDAFPADDDAYNHYFGVWKDEYGYTQLELYGAGADHFERVWTEWRITAPDFAADVRVLDDGEKVPTEIGYILLSDDQYISIIAYEQQEDGILIYPLSTTMLDDRSEYYTFLMKVP